MLFTANTHCPETISENTSTFFAPDHLLQPEVSRFHLSWKQVEVTHAPGTHLFKKVLTGFQHTNRVSTRMGRPWVRAALGSEQLSTLGS